jgi:hypothetical protein
MRIENFDVGVKRALKAYYRERGLPEGTAETSATARLNEAVALVRAKIGEMPQGMRTREAMEDITTRFTSAFADLKTWSKTNA